MNLYNTWRPPDVILFKSSTDLVGMNIAAASVIGESAPGRGCVAIGVNIPPMVGVKTVCGDALVGNESSRLSSRSRLVGSDLFVTGAETFFGFSSDDDESESDEEAALLSSLLSSDSDLCFFLTSGFGFAAGSTFASAFTASIETSWR